CRNFGKPVNFGTKIDDFARCPLRQFNFPLSLWERVPEGRVRDRVSRARRGWGRRGPLGRVRVTDSQRPESRPGIRWDLPCALEDPQRQMQRTTEITENTE